MKIDQARQQIMKILEESTNYEFLKLIEGSKLERMVSSMSTLEPPEALQSEAVVNGD